MTTTTAPQRCPACEALVNYEGHGNEPRHLTQHRFHCHSCSRVYVLQSTSHKMPNFAIKPHHQVQEEASH